MKSRFDDYASYLEKPMNLRSKFKFHCTMCGRCCIHREDILLNAKDIFNLAMILNISCKMVAHLFGDMYMGGNSRMPIIRLRSVGDDRRCPFLMPDNRCAVHEKKPTVCALYPLGRFIKQDVDKGEGSEIDYDSVAYLCNKVNCDKSRTHTVQEWLIRSKIPLEDEFFVKWTTVMFKIIGAMKAADIEDKRFCDALDRLGELLYFGYDTSKEFLPQFTDRIPRIDELLTALPWTAAGGQT